MKRQPPHVNWFIFTAIGLVILMAIGLGVLIFFFLEKGSELVLGSMIILGASVLTVLLFIMAAAFSSLNLTDRQQALGLPPGSVRALIALLLIIIWAIVSIFVIRLVAFGNINNHAAASADGVKLAQQLFTTMSTLVVAVAAFYFGSSSVRSARVALAPTSEQPVITNIIPNSGFQGQTDIYLTILGKNFGSPKSVRLVLNNEHITAGPPTYTQTDVSIIECKISIAANQTLGKWDVIVVNYDGTEYKQDKAFEVTKPPTPTPTPGTS
jgi:hypothetical protein